jgi:mRNA interferase HigB
MRVIARSALRRFWQRCPEAEQPLRAWFAETQASDWAERYDIALLHRTARFAGAGRVVFSVGADRFRLVVVVRYEIRCVYIRFVGTRAAYGRIDALEV